jgi:hypothetical protein
VPKLTLRSLNEVPAPNRTTKAIRESQLEYEGFVQSINSDVGELVLSEGEQPRGVKVRLRRAANRLSREIEIWDANGRVYFRVASKRGRPRKSAS